MNSETFEKIRSCYVARGFQVSRSWPFWGLNPFDTFTVTQGEQSTTFRESAFLKDAKRRGCYHVQQNWRHLELTENLMAQQNLLCNGLRWTTYRFEATGAVAFFLRELTRFKSGKYHPEDLSQSIRRMTLGMRMPLDKDDPRIGRVPRIPNVLEYIDEVDNFIKSISSVKKPLFRTNYEFLSEFCHPNAYGLMTGSKTIHSRVVEFEQRPRLSEKDLHAVLGHLLRSSYFFPRLYDAAWRIVEENFEMPELEK